MVDIPKKLFIIGLESQIPPEPPDPVDPNFPNLAIHMDASNSNSLTLSVDEITLWSNLGSLTGDFLSDVTGPTLVPNVLNSLPVARFDNTPMTTTDFVLNLENYTIYSVCSNRRVTLNDTLDHIFDSQEKSGSFNGVQVLTQNWYLENNQRQWYTPANGGPDSIYWKNGVITTTPYLDQNEYAVFATQKSGASLHSGTSPNLTFGGSNDASFVLIGDVGEIRIYSDTHTDEQVQEMMAYLAFKWGL